LHINYNKQSSFGWPSIEAFVILSLETAIPRMRPRYEMQDILSGASFIGIRMTGSWWL